MACLAKQSCSFCWASAIAIGFRMLLQYTLSTHESFLFLGPCFYSQPFYWVGMTSCVLCRISYFNYSRLISVLNLFFLNLSLCHNWESSTGNVCGKSETNILYCWCRLRLKYSIALCASHLSRNSFVFVRKQAFIRNALEYKLATRVYWLALPMCIGEKKPSLRGNCHIDPT